MIRTSDGKEIDEQTLKELYKLSIEQHRYQHSDIWRALQFYTTLNLGIIGAALALLRLGPQTGRNVILILFMIGAVTSVFGFLVIRKIRILFLKQAVHKTLIEYLLHYRSPLAEPEEVRGKELAVHWIYEKVEDILNNPEQWSKQNIYVVGSVTTFSMITQIIFLIINCACAYLLWSTLL